jgi:hypothetical protein
MDVSSVSTQSTAVAAYAAQLSARERAPAPTGGGIEDPNKPQGANPAAKPVGDEVTLSAEARNLAAPPAGEAAETGEPPEGGGNVAPAAAGQVDSPDNRAANAKSVAQAINAYLETSAV